MSIRPISPVLSGIIANSGKTTESVAREAGVSLSGTFAALAGGEVSPEVFRAVADALGIYPDTLKRLIAEAA